MINIANTYIVTIKENDRFIVCGDNVKMIVRYLSNNNYPPNIFNIRGYYAGGFIAIVPDDVWNNGDTYKDIDDVPYQYIPEMIQKEMVDEEYAEIVNRDFDFYLALYKMGGLDKE